MMRKIYLYSGIIVLALCHQPTLALEQHCGQIIWPAQADYLPFPQAMIVTQSTQEQVAKVIKKYGKHELELGYEDAAGRYKTLEKTIELILKQGKNEDICIDAETLEHSHWGTPMVVIPRDIALKAK